MAETDAKVANTEIQSTGNSDESKAKTGFKMPSALTIIFFILLGVIMFTWILAIAGASYTAEVDGIDTVVEVVPAGLLGIGAAVAEGFGNAYSLIFYLFVLGALIECLLVTGTLEAGVGSLVKGLNGKEIILIPLLFILFSAGGTTYGMQEETIGLVIIVVPALVLAGFDTITGLLVILLGTTTGFAMSTVNPFAVGAAEGALADVGIEVAGMGLIFRLVWWVILTAIGSVFVTGYALMVKKNENRSFNSAAKIEEDKAWVAENFRGLDEIETMNGRQKAAITIFMLLFVVMVMGMIPWWSFEFINNLGSGYYGGPEWVMDWTGPLAFIFNGTWGPGWWYFGELVMLFGLGTFIIIMVLGRKSFEEAGTTAMDTCWDGAKAMFSVAILIGVARAIPTVLEYTYAQDWLVITMTGMVGEGANNLTFIYAMVPILFVLSLIIPSTSGLAGAALPIIGGAATAISSSTGTDTAALMSAVMIVFLMTCGMANMFVPTQSVVLAQMEASNVDYVTALKPIMIYVALMFVILLAAIVPSTMLLL